MLRAKRSKLAEGEEEEEEGPSRCVRVSCANGDIGLTILLSDKRTEEATTAQHTSSSSKPTSNSIPKGGPREPDVRPSSPQRPSTSTNIDATKEPILDLTTHDTLEIPSSSPNRQASPLTDEHEPPRPAKHLKKRSRVPSEVFASEPSSPRRDPPVVSVGGPSSEAQPVRSAPSTLTNGTPVSTSTYPRAPPRVVDSFHGQVLVDQKGHIPRALLQNGAEEEPEEELKDKVQWPPLRSPKQREVSGPEVEVDTHHAFSQPQPRPPEVPQESAAKGEPERGKPHHPFENVPPPPDRRAVVAQFLGKVRHGVAPQVESERHEDAVRNGASPVKRVVPPAPVPLSDLVPKSSSKVLKFPAPRASTESPFRPESPAVPSLPPPPPQPQLQRQSRTKAARHPALTRIRRQSIKDGKRNEREHGRVPSIDLVALSHSSMSARSHSHSSTGASAPARPPRWSLPSFTHATPWVLDEPRGAPSAPGSGSHSGPGSPFRWPSSPVYGGVLGHGHAQTSIPRFTFTPSPARSITAVATDGAGPRADTSSSRNLAPHLPDLSLTASHGLASILAHMSVNHGLALGVVEAVYKRMGSLKEADEVLRGMREAAEGFGEREIERRVEERKRERRESGAGRNGAGREERKVALKYVVASEDGEGSEYSPPETSRAAMWKRQSESEGYAEEGGSEEDEEEGRAVEEELREGEDENDDEEGLFVGHHDFSQHVPALEEANDDSEVASEEEDRHDDAQDGSGPQEDAREELSAEALVEHIPAQELERKMGRGRFRKDIVMRFV